MSKGGYRSGAGRKSRAEELGLPLLLADTFSDEERRGWFQMLATIGTTAEKDADKVNALSLLLAYTYGKPRQQLELTGEGGGPVAIELTHAERTERITRLLDAGRARRAGRTPDDGAADVS